MLSHAGVTDLNKISSKFGRTERIGLQFRSNPLNEQFLFKKLFIAVILASLVISKSAYVRNQIAPLKEN